jgi:predicted lipid-binding transport protein (Tim44 family)
LLVDRRAFLGTIAGGLLAAPLGAEAQQRLLLGAMTALIIFLTGCSEASWIIPPGGSEQQLRRDSYQCQRDTAMLAPAPRPVSPAPTGFVHPSEGYTMAPQGRQGLGTAPVDRAQVEEGLVARCMESKGYRRQ